MVAAGTSDRLGAPPRVLVILDGASEPLGAGPTSLERAATPALDALAAAGSLSRLRTVAPGLPVGSETAIPALLGWAPPAPVDRGAVEAAAHELTVGPRQRAWRIDVEEADGARAGEERTRAAAAALTARLRSHAVHALAGHRLLVVGRPPLPALPMLTAAPGLSGGTTLHPWPEGIVPPRRLDAATTVVAARGAAAGVARLMGATVVVPRGATGRPGSDLAAKAAAALAALDAGAGYVVVHVGAPDEAAHERDKVAKVAEIERADRALVAPLVAAVRARGGTLRVCPDHGCDPRTGCHDGAPVPCVTWAPGADDAEALPRVARAVGGEDDAPIATARVTERAVAALPVVEMSGARRAHDDRVVRRPARAA